MRSFLLRGGHEFDVTGVLLPLVAACLHILQAVFVIARGYTHQHLFRKAAQLLLHQCQGVSRKCQAAILDFGLTIASQINAIPQLLLSIKSMDMGSHFRY